MAIGYLGCPLCERVVKHLVCFCLITEGDSLFHGHTSINM